MSEYRIEHVTADNVKFWVQLGLPDVSYNFEVSALNDENSISRFLVFRGSSPVARFSVLFGKYEAIIWWPTINQKTKQKAKLMKHIVKVLLEQASLRGIKLIQCNIPISERPPLGWTKALMMQGFKVTGLKAEWQVKKAGLSNQIMKIDAEISFKQSSLSEVDVWETYRSTIHDTVDVGLLIELESGAESFEYDFALIAYHREQRVGLCLVLQEADEDLAWINYVGVIPSYRRNGIGKCLLKKTVDFLIAKQFNNIKSLIADSNRPSISIHKSCGFFENGRFYKNLVWALPRETSMPPVT